MVAPIENYADVMGRVIDIRAHPALAGFVVVDIEVAAVAPVLGAGDAPYPNWYADSAGTTVSAGVRADAPGVAQVQPGSTIRCRIRGGGPGVTFMQPDSVRLEPT